MSLTAKEIIIPATHAINVFGGFDCFMKKIEDTLQVEIVLRDDVAKVSGESTGVTKACDIISRLLELAQRGNDITEQNVDYAHSCI